MSNVLKVSPAEIISQIKISGQMSVILEAIAIRRAIATAVIEAKVEVEIDELQEASNKFRAANNLELEEDTWLWLQKQGMSLDDFEEMLQVTILSTKVSQHLFAEQVESYFSHNYLNYAEIVMYEVILDDEDLASKLFSGLQEGKLNFYAVAHEYIQDEELRRVGGYRGLLHRSDLQPEISSVVFAAKPPQILKPIVTAKGVHLILVEELIQPELDQSLKTQIIADLFADWVKQQIDQVEIYEFINATSASNE
jgi:parvulin-like peptidyl-prolyl isomerase